MINFMLCCIICMLLVMFVTEFILVIHLHNRLDKIEILIKNKKEKSSNTNNYDQT